MNRTMKYVLILIAAFAFFSPSAKAQIEKVIVETYYVSDSLDATDTTDGRVLERGSKTYRIYIDLAPGCKLKKIFGSSAHPLKINSTASFFNNIDRPTEYFGYLIKKNYFNGNPTLALDSWLTIGWAGLLNTTHYDGVLKTQDTDGSIIGGANNGGGSSFVTGGILRNNDPAAGPALTSNDGWMISNQALSTWIDNGFKDLSNVDTTVFGSVNIGSHFYSTTAFLQQNSGVMGNNPDSNQVLVAQLTTLGDITFELNVDVIDGNGNVISYVAHSDPSDGNTVVLSPYLTYPPVCGCTDSRYLEYDPSYACGNPSDCHTLKVFGCTDSMACNFDPAANVLLPNFCCYPGYCNDRDIGLVCPNLSPNKIKTNQIKDVIYPNPVENTLSLGLLYSSDPTEVNYIIYDSHFGKVTEKSLGVISGNSIIHADVSELPPGLYLFYISAAGNSTIKKFIKN